MNNAFNDVYNCVSYSYMKHIQFVYVYVSMDSQFGKQYII